MREKSVFFSNVRICDCKKNHGQNSFQGHKMVIFIGSNLADCTMGPFCELKSF